MIDPSFALLSIPLSIAGSIGYTVAIIKGKAKPNRITWLLWTLAPMIAFAAQIKQGVGLAATMTFAAGFSPLIVLIASFVNKQAYWKIGRLDIVCGVLSVLALVLWLITKDGTLAIALSIATDLLAGLPTVVKAYKYPETENALAFSLSGIGAIITLATISNWSFHVAGFAVYLLCMNITIFSLVRFPRLLRKQTVQPL